MRRLLRWPDALCLAFCAWLSVSPWRRRSRSPGHADRRRVADRFWRPTIVLIAEGQVEVFYQGQPSAGPVASDLRPHDRPAADRRARSP